MRKTSGWWSMGDGMLAETEKRRREFIDNIYCVTIKQFTINHMNELVENQAFVWGCGGDRRKRRKGKEREGKNAKSFSVCLSGH